LAERTARYDRVLARNCAVHTAVDCRRYPASPLATGAARTYIMRMIRR